MGLLAIVQAAGISATSAGAVGARATQEEQDWLLRFKNPVLEEQFWLWWRRSKPALHDMTFREPPYHRGRLVHCRQKNADWGTSLHASPLSARCGMQDVADCGLCCCCFSTHLNKFSDGSNRMM